MKHCSIGRLVLTHCCPVGCPAAAGCVCPEHTPPPDDTSALVAGAAESEPAREEGEVRYAEWRRWPNSYPLGVFMRGKRGEHAVPLKMKQ